MLLGKQNVIRRWLVSKFGCLNSKLLSGYMGAGAVTNRSLSTMQHWYSGDRMRLPTIFEKFRSEHDSNLTIKTGSTVVRVTPGAGPYEDKFRHYWWIVAWCLLGFQALNMLAVTAYTFGLLRTYDWGPHLLGSAIVFMSMGFAALIYRFVLFPTPGYYSYGYAADPAVATAHLTDPANSHPNGYHPGAAVPNGVSKPNGVFPHPVEAPH